MAKWSEKERKEFVAERGGVLVPGLTVASPGDVVLAKGLTVCDWCDTRPAVTKAKGEDACAPCAKQYG